MLSFALYCGLCLITRGLLYTQIGQYFTDILFLLLPNKIIAQLSAPFYILCIPLIIFDLGTYFWRPLAIFSLLSESLIITICCGSSKATFFILRTLFAVCLLTLPVDIGEIFSKTIQSLRGKVLESLFSAKIKHSSAVIRNSYIEEAHLHLTTCDSNGLTDKELHEQAERIHRIFERKRRIIMLEFD